MKDDVKLLNICVTWFVVIHVFSWIKYCIAGYFSGVKFGDLEVKSYSKKYTSFYFGRLQNEEKKICTCIMIVIMLQEFPPWSMFVEEFILFCWVFRRITKLNICSLNDNSDLPVYVIQLPIIFYLAEGDIHVRVKIKHQPVKP